MYKSFAWRLAIVSSQVMADQVGGGVDDTPIDRSARRLERRAETDVELMAMMNTGLVPASGPLIEMKPAIGSFSRREGFADSTVPALQCDHRGVGRCRARMVHRTFAPEWESAGWRHWISIAVATATGMGMCSPMPFAS